MNERILIVDEDKNIRDLLASALKASGYGVLEAQSFAQARMLALSHCPDLMLLELNLPEQRTRNVILRTDRIVMFGQHRSSPVILRTTRLCGTPPD